MKSLAQLWAKKLEGTNLIKFMSWKKREENCKENKKKPLLCSIDHHRATVAPRYLSFGRCPIKTGHNPLTPIQMPTFYHILAIRRQNKNEHITSINANNNHFIRAFNHFHQLFIRNRLVVFGCCHWLYSSQLFLFSFYESS